MLEIYSFALFAIRCIKCLFFYAGLGSILFAVTVDSLELNVPTPAESMSPRQVNEIIIAVPTVSSLSERKTAAFKKAAVISFEEDENTLMINNNVLNSSATVPLSHACLKYQEKQKLAEEKAKLFVTDSSYERLHAEPINIGAISTHANETEYIEPESPTAIQIYNPVPQTYPALTNSYDYKETDSSLSKATDSRSIASNTSTHSSNSPNQINSQPSHSTSMSSSISSGHHSPNFTYLPENDRENQHEDADEHEYEHEHGNEHENNNEHENSTEYITRVQGLTAIKTEQQTRIQELEQRCVHLQDRVTALTL